MGVGRSLRNNYHFGNQTYKGDSTSAAVNVSEEPFTYLVTTPVSRLTAMPKVAPADRL